MGAIGQPDRSTARANWSGDAGRDARRGSLPRAIGALAVSRVSGDDWSPRDQSLDLAYPYDIFVRGIPATGRGDPCGRLNTPPTSENLVAAGPHANGDVLSC